MCGFLLFLREFKPTKSESALSSLRVGGCRATGSTPRRRAFQPNVGRCVKARFAPHQPLGRWVISMNSACGAGHGRQTARLEVRFCSFGGLLVTESERPAGQPLQQNMDQLTNSQVAHFTDEGFVRVNHAFPAPLADECRAILWKASQCDPNNPDTWVQPVIRIGEIGLEPFRKAANTTLLLNAFDQLAGKDNWLPRSTLGSFPIRFPGKEKAVDTGWHVDASFPGADANNYLDCRINIHSKGRALLMLFLFSDVAENDAPTRIRAGSHLDVAKLLAPAGDSGLSFMELARKLDATKDRKEIAATGRAGTVYLCHPFIAHAAQDHKGSVPKFMAQPPLLTAQEFTLHRTDGKFCPVEAAILKGLTLQG